ncbi:MAG TPA: hypothetical protein VLM37_13735, partial [Fibrobacteraceae bacterium]|nr:hypothetical protein [Fibrobacteraceae bacterium]
HDLEHWEELARVVINDRYGDNVRWYFLGRAAEGFGLCDAARHYYEISKKLSDDFVTRCLGLACGGIKLPEALKERFDSVEAMQSNGECRSQP